MNNAFFCISVKRFDRVSDCFLRRLELFIGNQLNGSGEVCFSSTFKSLISVMFPFRGPRGTFC